MLELLLTPGNETTLSSNTVVSIPRIALNGGLDWATTSLKVTWLTQDFLEAIAESQRKAQELNATVDLTWAVGTLVKVFAVEPRGRKGGNLYWNFVATCEGCRWSFRTGAKAQNVQVDVTSYGSMARGFNGGRIWASIQSMIGSLHGVIDSHSLGRLDPFADVDIRWKQVDDATANQQAYCRARYTKRHAAGDAVALLAQLSESYSAGRKAVHELVDKWFEQEERINGAELLQAIEDGEFDSIRLTKGETGTLYFGTSGVKCRIYDKSAEVRRDPTKQSQLQAIWDVGPETQVTRVEFQLDRVGLRRRGIKTWDDYFLVEKTLFEYLVNEWLTFRDTPSHDASHAKRFELLPFWRTVADAFAEISQHGGEAEFQEIATPTDDSSSLVRQAAGCLKSAVARTEGDAVDLDSIITAALEMVYTELRVGKTVVDVHRRAKVYETRVFRSGKSASAAGNWDLGDGRDVAGLSEASCGV